MPAVQTAIDVLGRVLPIVLDVAAMVPGVNIPVGAVRLVKDAIVVEQGAARWLSSTPEGQAVWSGLEGLASSLGSRASISPSGRITVESRDEVQKDFDGGVA